MLLADEHVLAGGMPVFQFIAGKRAGSNLQSARCLLQGQPFFVAQGLEPVAYAEYFHGSFFSVSAMRAWANGSTWPILQRSMLSVESDGPVWIMGQFHSRRCRQGWRLSLSIFAEGWGRCRE